MELIFLLFILLLNLIVAAAALLFVVWLVQSLILKAPFLPLPRTLVEKVVDMVSLSEQGKFYDLGSGDGRLVRAVAKRYSLATCYGIEKAIIPSLFAWVINITSRLDNIILLRKDYRAVSLDQANVVFLYLFPTAMPEVSEKLKTELVTGVEIISCRFELPGFALQKTETLNSKGVSLKFYFYVQGL